MIANRPRKTGVGFLVFSLAASALSLVSVVAIDGLAGADALQNNGSTSRNAWYQTETALTQASVTSGLFGQRFATHLEGSIMGQPVVVNGTLVVGTEEDRIYGLNPLTGAVKWSRVIGTPIQQAAQQGCGDLQVAGITASPVADGVSGAVYFLAKTYSNEVASGMVFKLHKVEAATGKEFENFPVTYGGVADNDPNADFDAEWQTQRTGLLLDQGVIYAGFASVCDHGDFKGWVFGTDGSTGEHTARFVTDAGTASGGGVWQSGVGIASDGPGQLLLTTGNGTTPKLGTPGNEPPGALGQSVVRLVVQSDRTLKATDFFTPVTGDQLNEVDGDLGSGGPVILPSSFHTTGASEILANGSKGGYLYLVNGKNLGGIGTGKNGGDATVATLGPIGAMFGSPVAWSGGGGYLYTSAVLSGLEQSGSGPSLAAYKWGVTSSGDAAITLAGSAREQPGFGSSSPVLSSNGTSTSSAILWQIWKPMVGGNAELRAFNPIPANGQLQQLWSAPVGPLSKFLNPVIDSGSVYVGSNDGTLFGFGLAAKAPLVATSLTILPTPAGTAKTSNVTITANRPVTIRSLSSSSTRFVLSKVALPKVLAAGGSLTIPVTFKPTTSGSTSASLVVAMNGEANVALPLNSYGIYVGPRLTLSSPILAFGNGGRGGTPLTASFSVTNVGSASALITSASGLKAPFVVTSALVGKTILPGRSLPVIVKMTLGTLGQFTSSLAIAIKGQTISMPLVGSVGQPALVTVEPASIAFGEVPLGQSVVRTITLTNTGNTPANWYASRPYFLGSQGAFFLVGSQTSSTIPAHSSVSLKIRFTPDPEEPDDKGMLQFNIDDGLVPRQVWFSGAVGAPVHPVLNVASINVYPGDSTAWVPVDISPTPIDTVTFTVKTIDGTATAESGAYQATSGIQTSLAGGMRRAYIPIPVDPSLGAGKSFSVSLKSANGAALGSDGTVFIRGSRTDGVAFVTADAAEFVVSQVEDQQVQVPVVVAPILSAPVTCRATTADGSATTANGDYVGLSNQLVTIPPTGIGSVSIKVKAKATLFSERNFSVTISQCSGDGALSLVRSTATVTLLGQLNRASLAELQLQKVVIIAPGIGKTGYQNVVVRNVGGSSITFRVTTPISDAHFGLGAPLTAPITIAAGSTYTMRLSYRATSTALTRASLAVQASTDEFPQIINLLGESN